MSQENRSGENLAATTMSVADFLRAYQVRQPNIMWLLGAGASRSAGIKTAGDMIWDFKQLLYRSHKKLPPKAIPDPGDPAVRRKLQAYFNEQGSYPPDGSSDEYSFYFEASYPHRKDRQAYLDNLIRRGKPSYGHMALALLLRENCCRIIWTTNFDRTLEDAAARLFGTTNDLIVADLGEPSKAINAYKGNRYPIYGKLHGDYHSEKLKNTDEELQSQDEDMRHALVDTCKNYGIAIVGYSGRDKSVLEALRSALDNGRGFPGGLFWFKRSGSDPYDEVVALIKEARDLGIDAHFIDCETFDELLSDLVRFLPETSGKLNAISAFNPPRLGNAAIRPPGAVTPAIRTNALPVISHPVMCRLVDCDIGGWKEIERAVADAGVKIEAQRMKEGVIAFGRDCDIKAAFQTYGIKRFETRSIPDKNLTYESADLRLIRDALFNALNHNPRIEIIRRGRRVFAVPNESKVKPSDFNDRNIRPVDRISGIVGDTGIRWVESCGLRIDYKLDRLWLLLEPRIFREMTDEATESQIEQSREFVRSRSASRYNPKQNAMLTGWSRLLLGNDNMKTLRTFSISDGIDATFEISKITGFSGKGDT